MREVREKATPADQFSVAVSGSALMSWFTRSGSATKPGVMSVSAVGHQRPGLMLLSAFICRSGAGSCGSLLLAEHLLHCHHCLGSLLSLQLFHYGESQTYLQHGIVCAMGPYSLLYVEELFMPQNMLVVCAKSLRQHPAGPFPKRFISPGGRRVVLMGTDACPLEGLVPSPLWHLLPITSDFKTHPMSLSCFQSCVNLRAEHFHNCFCHNMFLLPRT